jgi:hypothetical protein
MLTQDLQSRGCSQAGNREASMALGMVNVICEKVLSHGEREFSKPWAKTDLGATSAEKLQKPPIETTLHIIWSNSTS